MNSIRQNIKRLMQIHNLNEIKLANAAGIRQSVLNRILTGKTPQPKIETLILLAQYFSLSLDDLVGYKSLHHACAQEKPATHDTPVTETAYVPLLPLSSIYDWCQFNLQESQIERYICCSNTISNRGFAFVCQDTTMAPCFPKGSVIIMDPERKTQDQAFVLVCDKYSKDLWFRRYMLDGNTAYMQAMNSNFCLKPMTESHVVLSSMVMVHIKPELLQASLL